jgi:hypothetical protein
MGEKCTSGIVVDAVGLTEVAVRRVFGVRARSGDYHNQLSCAWPLFVKDFSRRDDGLSTRCCGRRPKSAKARNRGRSQHHHSRANLHPIVEIDHILIGYPDATRGNRTSDVFGLVGAVDAIQRVLAAGVKV